MKLTPAILAFSLYCIPLQAALTITKIGVTNTSLAIRVSGATGGDCTIELSENPSYAPLAADVDGTKYTGAGSCAGRSDTVTSGSDLLVTLGHKVSDRALYTDTTYYLRVRSGVDTATLTFKTDTIGVGQSFPWPVPVDRRHYANRGFGGTVATIFGKQASPDPVTGVRMWPLAHHLKSIPIPHSFVHWTDGKGWTNPSHIIDTTSSGAQTNNTNPLTLYFGTESDPLMELYKNKAWDDLGIIVYACGDDANASNRTFTLTVSNNFSVGTMGTPVTVTGVTQCSSPPTPLPHVASTSTFTDNPWPSSYPAPPFSGWGTGAFFGMDDRPTKIKVNSVSGVLTIDSSYAYPGEPQFQPNWWHHVSPSAEAGNKVAFPGCTEGSGLCTISSVKDSKTLTVSDSIANTTGDAQVLRAGVRIAKTTAAGNLWVSVKYKFAESMLSNTTGGALGTQCNTNSGPLLSGDGHSGYLCIWTTGNQSKYMYFVSDDGTNRLVWSGSRPTVGYFTGLGWAEADIPEKRTLTDAIFPDPNDARGWYVQGTHADGSPQAVYRMHYSGTVPELIPNYTYDAVDWGTGSPLTAPNDFFDWSVVSPASSSIQAQLDAKFPYYPGSIAGYNFTFEGVSGTTAYFSNKNGGGQDHPGWVAVADISTLPMTITNVFSTYEGHGVNGKTHFGSIHNIGVRPFPADAVVASMDPLPYGIVDEVYYRGPFKLPILAIDRGRVGAPSWSTNTAIHWPIPTDGTYLNTCPANTLGWTGTRCLHIKTTPGGECDTQPHHLELAGTPCPANTTGITAAGWNPSSYAQPFPIRKGDTFADANNGCGSAPGDCENFTVITDPVREGDGSDSVWVARDAGKDYCCILCALPQNSPGQYEHPTGWIGAMLPNAGVGCSGGVYIVQGKTEAAQTLLEVPRTLAGHTELVEGSVPGNVGFVQATGSNQGPTLASVFDPSTQKAFATPTWHGTGTSIGGGVQSYAATPGRVPWMLDANAVLGHNANEVPWGGGIPSSTVTATSCANVYKITPTGATNYKYIPLRGVAGAHPLQEVSSPTVDLCSSSVPDFSLAYAYANGEAMHGTVTGGGTSVAGNVFVKVPKAQADLFGQGTCVQSQHWANTPCVIGGADFVGAGFYRQNDWTANNSTGTHTHWLTSGQEVPTAQYGYTGFVPVGTGAAWAAWSLVDNWGTAPWLIKLPTFVNDGSTINRTDYISVPVTASAMGGATKARVRFGRNPSFYCIGSDATAADGSLDWSGRKEACVTDASGTAPFKFASESQTLQSCASGCTINVPVVAQTVNYAQVEYLNDAGGIVQTGPIQILTAGDVIIGPCSTLTIAPSSISALATGGPGTLAVTADSGCTWTASASAGWITATGGANGSGTISYTVDANGGSMRSATVTVEGVTVPVSQTGIAGLPSTAPRISGARVTGGRIQ